LQGQSGDRQAACSRGFDQSAAWGRCRASGSALLTLPPQTGTQRWQLPGFPLETVCLSPAWSLWREHSCPGGQSPWPLWRQHCWWGTAPFTITCPTRG